MVPVSARPERCKPGRARPALRLDCATAAPAGRALGVRRGLTTMFRSLVWMLAALLQWPVMVDAQSAPVAKVLRYAFPSAETGFDPAQVTDLYSNTVIAHVFEADRKSVV